MILDEGNKYSFRITKSIDIEGEIFFVLKGPGTRRFLVKQDIYKNYGLKTGQTIVCRVDKINCNGEVFLEPAHPYYKEGEEYEFMVTGHDRRLGKKGEMFDVLLLKGEEGTETVVNAQLFEQPKPEVGSSVSLRIDKISKGRLIGFDRQPGESITSENGSGRDKFRVQDIARGVDNRLYYRVESQGGNTYSMPVDYYKEYGLEPGKEFWGRIVSYNNGTQLRVEPENQWFRQGEYYNFRIKSITPLAQRAETIVIVTDERNKTHRLITKRKFIPGQTVRLKVERIRRGKPYLTFL